jgi:hypothetical protein
MDVFPVTWSAADSGPGGTCRVTVFGKTPAGEAACVHVRFTPFFYVEMPAAFSDAQCRPLLAQWGKQYDLLADKCRVVRRTSLWGFRAGRAAPFAQLVFPSLEAYRRARYGLARGGNDTYEAGVDPVVRLFHARGIGPGRWMRVDRHAPPRTLVADVDVEVECAFTDVRPGDLKTRPPLVFASEPPPRRCLRASCYPVVRHGKTCSRPPPPCFICMAKAGTSSAEVPRTGSPTATTPTTT